MAPTGRHRGSTAAITSGGSSASTRPAAPAVVPAAVRFFRAISWARAIGEAGSAAIASSIAGTGASHANPARATASPTSTAASATAATRTGAHRRPVKRAAVTRAAGSRSAASIAKAWKAIPPWRYASR